MPGRSPTVLRSGRSILVPRAHQDWYGGSIELTFGSYWLTLPSSCPAMMYLAKKLHPATVALLSLQVMRRLGSSACWFKFSPLPSPYAMSRTAIVPKKPIRFSVTAKSLLPSGENATRFTAVGNSQTFTHSPVLMFHSRTVLSADPVARRMVLGLTSTVQIAPW